MRFEYKTRGTCSSKILFDVDDGIVHNLEYIGGSTGNKQRKSLLVKGMNNEAVIARVQGIHCGMKPTSCPDQLAQALLIAKEKLAKEAQPEA